MNDNVSNRFPGFPKSILIVFIVCLTILISTNPFVLAQVGIPERASETALESEIMLDPVPGGPGFIMVSVFDFQPYGPSYPQAYTGTGLYNPSVDSLGDSVTGVTLPNGATITKVTMYFKDNST